MEHKDENNANKKADEKLPAASTGNASNPSPGNKDQYTGNQLFPGKAEKYLRESGNIEDLPDAEEDIDSTAK